MNGIALWVALFLLAVAGLALWVRLAPVDPARWHVDPQAAPDPGPGGYRAVLSLDLPAAQALARIDAVARATPRTRLIAGSVEAGRMTWESRSRLWRFPDYTTAQATAEDGRTRLAILGRLRFGVGDQGVNRRRIRNWIKQAELVAE